MRPPALSHPSAAVFLGDCLDVLAKMPDASVDAIVTDPPYGLGFMGKAWDDLPPGLPWAEECLRVLKPGGHLLAFGGTRTWHRLAVAVEDAGFEVRDSIAWLYGSGFPKSLDVSKAIDKAAGATREVTGRTITPFKVDAAASRGTSLQGSVNGDFSKQTDADGYRYTEHTAPATPAAQQWAGWGTALKPAFEPIVVARKPLIGTVAANVLAHGTGALNIDGTRVESDGSHMVKGTVTKRTTVSGDERTGKALGMYGAGASFTPTNHEGGRWPANVLLDGSQADALDAVGPHTKDGVAVNRNRTADNDRANYSSYQFGNARGGDVTYGGEGGPSRFFPVFPASANEAAVDMVEDALVTMAGSDAEWQEERVAALMAENFPEEQLPTFRYQAKAPTRERPTVVAEDGTKTAHPTVKPLALMRWLVRLVTPPGGIVLDTFAGSGATIEAAVLEGFHALGIEREADYLPLIQVRLDRLPTT